MKNKINKCKHNWHYVGTETFRKSCGYKSIQYSHFICDICGITKCTEVMGYLNKATLNKEKFK